MKTSRPHAAIPVRRQAACVTARSSQQLRLPGESCEVGISLSLSLALSFSPSFPQRRSSSEGEERERKEEEEKEGEAHADSWREPQRVDPLCVRVCCVRVHYSRC